MNGWSKHLLVNTEHNHMFPVRKISWHIYLANGVLHQLSSWERRWTAASPCPRGALYGLLGLVWPGFYLAIGLKDPGLCFGSRSTFLLLLT